MPCTAVGLLNTRAQLVCRFCSGHSQRLANEKTLPDALDADVHAAAVHFSSCQESQLLRPVNSVNTWTRQNWQATCQLRVGLWADSACSLRATTKAQGHKPVLDSGEERHATAGPFSNENTRCALLDPTHACDSCPGDEWPTSSNELAHRFHATPRKNMWPPQIHGNAHALRQRPGRPRPRGSGIDCTVRQPEVDPESAPMEGNRQKGPAGGEVPGGEGHGDL